MFSAGTTLQQMNPLGAAGLGQGNVNAGYMGAMQNLQNAQNLNNQTTSAGQMQLGQQLQQNQSKTQQGLINSGLGNTTVAQTMQQAPLQTYNMGMANLQNQQALRGMGVDQEMAGMTQQAGNTIGGMQNQGYLAALQGLQQNQNVQARTPTAFGNNAQQHII